MSNTDPQTLVVLQQAVSKHIRKAMVWNDLLELPSQVLDLGLCLVGLSQLPFGCNPVIKILLYTNILYGNGAPVSLSLTSFCFSLAWSRSTRFSSANYAR